MATNPAQRWTAEAADSARREVDARLAAASGVEERVAVLRHALGSDGGSGDDLVRFHYCLAALRFHADHGQATPAECKRLRQEAEAILRMHQIVPGKSKLAFLHGDLAAAWAHFLARAGQGQAALWSLIEGERESLGADDEAAEFRRLVALGAGCLRRGQAKLGAEILLAALATEPKAPGATPLIYARALWLSGDRGEALNVLESLAQDGEDSADAAWLRAVIKNDRETARKISRDRGTERPAYVQVEAALMLHADRAKNLAAEAPTVAALRRRLGKDPDQAVTALLRALKAVEDLGDTGIPLTIRMEKLGEALAEREGLATKDQELLVTAAAARGLARLSQFTAARILAEEYRLVCLATSGGDESDVFHLVGDLYDKAWYRPPTTAVAKVEEAPRPSQATGWQRSLLFSRSAVKALGWAATHRTRRLWASEAEKSRLDLKQARRMADLLVSNMTAARGAMVKVGQILSTNEMDLPPFFQELLAPSSRAVEPAANATMFAVFREEFGKSPEEVFAEFDKTPVAVASIGQVYRAVTHDGAVVAVKIQYPEIADTIHQDVRTLAIFAPLVSAFAPSLAYREILSELEQVLVSECDYLREAKAQQAAIHTLGDIVGLKIPKVYPELSSRRVLVTEWVSGQTLQEFAATADQKAKDRAGDIVARATYRAFFDVGLVNVDPHPGNFLFTESEVVLLDFGCTKEWDPAIRDAWSKLIRSTILNDLGMFSEACREVGIVVDEAAFDFVKEFEISRAIFETMRVPSYTMTKERLREIAKLLAASPNRKSGTFAPSALFLYRVIWGANSLFATLGATISPRDICQPYLFPDETSGSSAA